MKYERLTERKNLCGREYIKLKDCDRYDCEYCISPCEDAKDRLAELEDKIEDGRLVELPCKVGYKVFYKCPDDDDYRKGEIVGIAIEKNGNWFHAIYEGGLNMWHKTEDIGQYVFRSEAEAELKELRYVKNDGN